LEKNKISLNDKLNFFSSIASLQNGRGLPSDSSTITNFINDLRDFSNKNLNISNLKEFLKLLSSVTKMQCGLSVPDNKKLEEFLLKVLNYGKDNFNINDNTSFLKFLSLVTNNFKMSGIPTNKEFEKCLKNISL